MERIGAEDKRRADVICPTHSQTSVASRDTVTVFSDYAVFSIPSITRGLYPPAVPSRLTGSQIRCSQSGSIKTVEFNAAGNVILNMQS